MTVFVVHLVNMTTIWLENMTEDEDVSLWSTPFLLQTGCEQLCSISFYVIWYFSFTFVEPQVSTLISESDNIEKNVFLVGKHVLFFFVLSHSEANTERANKNNCSLGVDVVSTEE